MKNIMLSRNDHLTSLKNIMFEKLSNLQTLGLQSNINLKHENIPLILNNHKNLLQFNVCLFICFNFITFVNQFFWCRLIGSLLNVSRMLKCQNLNVFHLDCKIIDFKIFIFMYIKQKTLFVKDQFQERRLVLLQC
jgi:Leucine-rich repeat (LRR) protein